MFCDSILTMSVLRKKKVEEIGKGEWSEDVCFFFFQAEDGIRDHCVTGVQTCALPILFRCCTAPSVCACD